MTNDKAQIAMRMTNDKAQMTKNIVLAFNLPAKARQAGHLDFN